MTQNKCSYSVFFRVLMERETGVENTSLGKIKALLSWWWIPQFRNLRRLILNLHYCASDLNFARLQNLSCKLVLKIRSGMFTVWQRRDFFSLSFKRDIFFSFVFDLQATLTTNYHKNKNTKCENKEKNVVLA